MSMKSTPESIGAPARIRVALVDDHQLFRDALRTILAKEPQIDVVCTAGDGQEAMNAVIESGAEIVCMDIAMPRMNGIEATRLLLAKNPALKVVGLSANCDRAYVLDLLKAGALGYVTKSTCCDELLRAIRSARLGRTYLCPEVGDAVAGALLGGNGAQPATRLSTRERQVLQLVAEGYTSPQIAARLFVAISTAEVHRRNIMRKLSLHSVAELTKYAIRRGITTNGA
ncbi:MAG: response regulator transcription factor [Rhodocyclaceae bacterium]|nr:response regulator transcription factor [Rhodocyclaceae bacterium]